MTNPESSQRSIIVVLMQKKKKKKNLIVGKISAEYADSALMTALD
jgi:hypothetical protein